MSDVLIAIGKVIWNGIVDNILLEAMFFLEIQIESPSFLEYSEGMPKSIIKLINADQQRISKITLWQQKTP